MMIPKRLVRVGCSSPTSHQPLPATHATPRLKVRVQVQVVSWERGETEMVEEGNRETDSSPNYQKNRNPGGSMELKTQAQLLCVRDTTGHTTGG